MKAGQTTTISVVTDSWKNQETAFKEEGGLPLKLNASRAVEKWEGDCAKNWPIEA